MNNYDWLTPRIRRRNLFIVEGNHEKNKLMGLLLKIYPEIDIEWEDIIIYTTNIYQLYELIRKKYNDNWYDTDVDLPFIVGEKLKLDETLHKEDFMNILLIFDYERHDPSFSEEKMKQQVIFSWSLKRCKPVNTERLPLDRERAAESQWIFGDLSFWTEEEWV